MLSKSLIAFGAASVAMASEWTLQSSTTVTMVVGVGANSETNVIAAASQNGVGAVMESFDGEKWSKQVLPAGILMDAAVSDQVSVGVSMWEVLLSNDGGANYVVSENVKGLSQSCSVFGEGNDIGLVGTFTASADARPVSGVAHSADAGATWSVSAVPVGYARYGSFPSKDTWYVTSGIWGDDVSKTNNLVPLSSRVDRSVDGSMSFNYVNATSADDDTDDTASGWWGAISKTSDGGKTWSTVFQSQPSDVYYFNGISCSSETHCLAVAEGNTYPGFVTFDGGNTWEETVSSTLPAETVSLMAVDWVNDNEGWVASTSKNGRVLSGVFLKTTDGGKTFNIEQSLSDCFPIDMDFGGSLGTAACLSSSGSSGSVALYK